MANDILAGDQQKAAFSLDEFCRRNSISRRTLYNMFEDGIAPRTMKLRERRLISAEAEADWHREREQSVEPQPPRRVQTAHK